MTTTTMNRTEALDALDDLRETLVHSDTCELPGSKCDACDADHLIARVIAGLWDGYPLDDVRRTAHHVGYGLPYEIDQRVRRIVQITTD